MGNTARANAPGGRDLGQKCTNDREAFPVEPLRFKLRGADDRCLHRSGGGPSTAIHALVDMQGPSTKLKLTADQVFENGAI